jgi:UDP-2,3-diacylglucosamine hydrolase
VTTLFISDLHLDPSRPATTDAFLRFVKDASGEVDTLYILGDLFESWTGDDELEPHQVEVASALARLTDSGTRCFFMYGNRDFLIGKQFLNASKLTLLHDPTLICVGGESVLVSHGDIYCTDDVSYQRYRSVVRNPLVRRIYDALPRFVRDRIVAGLRSNSQTSTQYKAAQIMDVNGAAIEQAFRDFHPTTLLHGHTHRPAIHELIVDGEEVRRIVLGDWYEQGSILRWDKSGPRLDVLKFA